MSETTPLVTASRDALADVLSAHEPISAVSGQVSCSCDGLWRDRDDHAEHVADALLATVVRPVDGLADDEALVERVAAEVFPNSHGIHSRVSIRQAFTALAAALATPTDPSET